MDDEIEFYEPTATEAPALILGKKKKKKKKPKDSAAGASDTPVISGDVQKEYTDRNASERPDGEGQVTSGNAFASLHNGEAENDLNEDGNITSFQQNMTALEEDDDNATESNHIKTKKKKKKKKPVTEANENENTKMQEPEDGSSFANVEVEVKKPLTAAEKKKAKKEREKAAKEAKKRQQLQEEEDFDAIIAKLDATDDQTASSAKKLDVPSPNPNKIDDTGVNDLLHELDDNKVSSAAKKKSKKKKKANVHVALAEDEVNEVSKHLVENADIGADARKQSKPAAIGNVDNLLAELGGDPSDVLASETGEDGGSKMTAAQKKKAKKKKKAKAADANSAKVSESAELHDTKKGKKKKESVAVRKMREQQERATAAAEALRKEREEEENRIAEEERIMKEAEQKKIDDRARKRAADKARKERRRAEGKLMTKAERERRRKADQYLEQLREQGIGPKAPIQGGSSQSSRRVFGGRKKKKNAQGSNSALDAIGPDELHEIPSSSVASLLLNESMTKSEDLVNGEARAIEVNVASSDVSGRMGDNLDDWEELGEVDLDQPQSEDTENEDAGAEDSVDEDAKNAKVIAEERRAAVRRKHESLRVEALKARSPDDLRSPVICILGHVDTGKTKILDRIRRTNVQDGEAGGITQQIGATYFPIEAVKKETMKLDEGPSLSYNVPSLLIIDTPGHESFTNLRSRGSSLCDIAILVIDIMHGIEKQTLESINLLKLRKTPFIVALNKIDRMFDWAAQSDNCPSIRSLSMQEKHVKMEFKTRVQETKLALSELGFNSDLYWENDDPRKTISLVPTSAVTGEGMPDLLMHLLTMPQKLLTERIMYNRTMEATVLEVKVVYGLGTTIDIILTGGTIHEGDTIMVVGLDGPITTTIRALLTPHPMKEMRVKGQYQRHSSIKAAQGIKISADGLEKAVAGTQIVVVADRDDEYEVEYAREEVMKDFNTILKTVQKNLPGVYVQASTLGSLEALLEFLRESKIDVSGINIGPVHKRDVKNASTQLEKNPQFAVILAFDVKVEAEAKESADELGVKIFTADIIYHLFDEFTNYMEELKQKNREDFSDVVVFPSICSILPEHVYNKRNPVVLGVTVNAGTLRVGTPLVVKKDNAWVDIGRIASIEANQQSAMTAKRGESVCIKIQHKNGHITYGRHFDFQDKLMSKITRPAIELLKKHYREELEKEDWLTIIKLKALFRIV